MHRKTAEFREQERTLKIMLDPDRRGRIKASSPNLHMKAKKDFCPHIGLIL
jgi:hypothetical protein